MTDQDAASPEPPLAAPPRRSKAKLAPADTGMGARIPDEPRAPLSAPLRPRVPEDDPLFDEFYAAYPRKTGKQMARREWRKVTNRRTGADPQRVIIAARQFRNECRAKNADPNYVPHPGTWLRDGRYEDEVPAVAAVPAEPASRREWRWQSDEQLLATVIRLNADRDHPVSAADAIIRAVRAQFPAGVPEGFPFVSAERGRELATMRYADYLLTDEWQGRRRAMLKAAGYRCMVCNQEDSTLDVHHRTYERRGTEHPSDLVVLCHECHMLFHRKGHLRPPAEDEMG